MTSQLLAKSKHANRGKKAEELVSKFLSEWVSSGSNRDYERLVDAKAAGRTIKAAASDFCAWTWTPYGSYTVFLEVKQTTHPYRLAKDKLPQLARLRKRASCGCTCIVLVFHSELEQWRAVPIDMFEVGVPSWDLSKHPTSETAREALLRVKPGAFK